MNHQWIVTSVFSAPEARWKLAGGGNHRVRSGAPFPAPAGATDRKPMFIARFHVLRPFRAPIFDRQSSGGYHHRLISAAPPGQEVKLAIYRNRGFCELKKRAYLLTVFSVGVLMFIGCDRSRQGTVQPSEVQQAIAANFRQLELKIGAAKAVWGQNEPIVASVYLINNGREYVIVTGHRDWTDYQISLVDENDRPVPMDMSPMKQLNRGSGSSRSIDIGPGETVENRIPLGEDYEINRKGVYKMTVRRRVGIHGVYYRELISNTITISVVE